MPPTAALVVNLVESDSRLDPPNVRRFCESGLYGPALEKPLKWFGMPWYNCTDPRGSRESGAVVSFWLVLGICFVQDRHVAACLRRMSRAAGGRAVGKRGSGLGACV